MSKSGTLTYHTGYNYGASLQAYALQQVIKRECGDNKIINFQPDDFVHSREMITKHPRRLKEVIKIATRLRYISTLRERQALFDDFTEEQLDVTELCRTRDEVIVKAKEFDCIVCGSDQIWNLGAPGDEYAANSLFFLDFPKAQRRVSYAASFGKWVKEADSREDEFLPWIRQFDAVSVREDSGVEYLRSRGIDCVMSVDPTLLLDASDYRVIGRCPNSLPERYVLVFGWAIDSGMVRVAKIASMFYGAPALNIVPPPRAMFSGIKRKLDVGPREFLYMIDNAQCVVTNSFHGTVFSSIFKKPFVSLYGKAPDTRMKSTLETLGLTSRLKQISAVDSKYFEELFADDFTNMDERLHTLRADSISYLRENVR